MKIHGINLCDGEPQRGLTLDDVKRAMAEVYALEPWRKLVGKVELRRSEWTDEGSIYCCDSGGFGGLFVVVHVKQVKWLRESIGGRLSDGELAAILWWRGRARGDASR